MYCIKRGLVTSAENQLSQLSQLHADPAACLQTYKTYGVPSVWLRFVDVYIAMFEMKRLSLGFYE